MSPTSAQAFQDDLIYWSDSYEEHVEQTERLVAALSFQGIKLNASKVHMFCSYVRYLSCIVGNEELHMDPLKVKAIDDMASPIDICSPLTDLLKKIPDPNGTVDPQTGKVRNVWAAARRTTAARRHHGLRGHVLEESGGNSDLGGGAVRSNRRAILHVSRQRLPTRDTSRCAAHGID